MLAELSGTNREGTVRIIAIVLAACLLAAGAAVAQKVDNAEGAESEGRIDCITVDYVAYEYDGPSGVVPDGDPYGAVFGLLPTDAGHVIQDVLLSVDITQTWIGDLRMWLLYDTDCDGYSDFIGQVLCRDGMVDCTADGCCGCSGNFNGWYTFDDTAPSIEDECLPDFPPGCYGPDYKSVGLDVFNGLASGGCWMLWVADGAGGDVTTVREWTAFVLYEGTPVEQASWGRVKALYR